MLKHPTMWLSNELRPYFGLQPLEDSWEFMELRAGYWVVLDGDVIRKCIASYDHAYSENDVQIVTRDRSWIEPQKANGKEKKLNFSNITSMKTAQMTFSAGIQDREGISSGYVTVRNPNNSISLPIRDCKSCNSPAALIDWLQQYPSQLPPDYDTKLERLLHAKRKRHKTVPGDIFRIELDLFTDGYVLVVGDLRQMQKDGLFDEHSLWQNVMTMPLFVRPYLYRTTDREPDLSEIISAPQSSHSIIVMDDLFLRGTYEQVGHTLLKVEDIAFPIGYGRTKAKDESEHVYSLSWGTGTAFKPESQVQFQEMRTYMNNGVYAGIFSDSFEALENRDWPTTLDHPRYTQARQQAMAEFGFSADISYDDFNEQTSGLTRQQYLDYLQRTYPRYKKAKASN